ncbi:uncharacterized protein F5891DRAFT_978226 [Suillus fuscotomentosus]|uniref:CCHC-type domain-containing protein n=1 Tax=Suillus fuscotomentosus TaxID=1912939 RepID=A0AAD4EBN4_9AGAM|nr:uncharacterized protein F5891DRAFT_978226 [Suillus fuscotomentosus]KAG1903201.1 hypothetical protein F5891DRAFT_978226 [Suillus fuscotomentosus]
MTTSFDKNSAIVSLKDLGYPKILDHLEKGALAETAILSPDHFLEIDTILGNTDVRTTATTSLVNVVSREDPDAASRALAVLQLQKTIRAMALHLLPDNFTDTIALATKRVGEKIDRPVRTLKRKKATVDHTCICLRCGGYGHTFRKCPDYVCCVCSELGPDHLSVHCPRLNGEIQLQEFIDDEKFFETLIDWEKNHIVLEALIAQNPLPRSPTPHSCTMTPAPSTLGEEKNEDC